MASCSNLLAIARVVQVAQLICVFGAPHIIVCREGLYSFEKDLFGQFHASIMCAKLDESALLKEMLFS